MFPNCQLINHATYNGRKCFEYNFHHGLTLQKYYKYKSFNAIYLPMQIKMMEINDYCHKQDKIVYFFIKTSPEDLLYYQIKSSILEMHLKA